MQDMGTFKETGHPRKGFHPERLIFYRNIPSDPLIKMVTELRDLANQEPDPARRDRIFYQISAELVQKAEVYHWQSDLWKHYITLLLAQAENTFSRTSAWSQGKKLDQSLIKLTCHDFIWIKEMWDFDFRSLGDWVPGEVVAALKDFNCAYYDPKQNQLRVFAERISRLCQGLDQAGHPEEMMAFLTDYYRQAGYGKVGMYSSFRWEGDELKGIPYPDPVTLGDLIGYAYQKEIILQNTEAFIRGKKANNLLLYGERGTGKSSTIKALVNEYGARGLRLVEVAKNQFASLPDIMSSLRKYPQRFIIFIDDLSFENNETEYKYLKYILEGGMEVIPDNVVIYATSNRRHLVQENWQDREGGGEVRLSDSVSEKLSLADRFGITVTFTSPDQDEFLAIVEGLALKNGVDLPKAELRERALKWERWHNGRSGRTAKQFINDLLTRL